MSAFYNKLRNFFGTDWSNDYDVQLNNVLLQSRQKMLQDQPSAQKFLKDFAANNPVIIQKTSEKFQDAFQELTQLMTENVERKNTKMKKERTDIILEKLQRSFKGTAYNPKRLREFVEKNSTKVEKLVLSKDSIDRERLLTLIENYDIMENDTSDINVMDKMAGSAKDRLKNFDPYKDVTNTDGKSKTIIKFDADVLTESLQGIKINEMFLLTTDILDANSHSNIIIEAAGEKKRLIIDRKDFVDFVYKNADIREHVYNNKFNFNGYMSARPIGFQTQLFKEYFNSKLMEDENVDFNIDSIDIDPSTNNIEVLYYYPNDEQSRPMNIPIGEFIDFLEQTGHDFNTYTGAGMAGDVHSFSLEQDEAGFMNYWDNINIQGQAKLMKDFIKGRMSEGTEGLTESTKVTDFNVWKSEMATIHGHFVTQRLNEKVTAKLDSIVLGEWDTKSSEGYIYTSKK